MTRLERHSLGRSGLEVSAFAIGSWRTFERIPLEQGADVLREARRCGIDFMDVARYDDETGSAPIRSGYSEVVFGEAFRAAGVIREEVVVAEKLWWEHWPRQSARAELDESLERLGFDRVDLIYSDPPPADLPMARVAEEIGGLLDAGLARAWGVVNWPAARIAAVSAAADDAGIAEPAAVQLPYSLVRRSPVEDAGMQAVLERVGASVVASYALFGGVLSGRYSDAGAAGRMTSRLHDPAVRDAVDRAAALRPLAAELGVDVATLAYGFASAGPRVASVLFGATTPEQVRRNVRRLDDEQLAQLRRAADG